MKKIDINNYELFIVDYLDGNLSNKEIDSLRAFAILHPELDIDLTEELPVLEKELEVFKNKGQLKKDFSFDSFENLAIGNLEGDNDDSDNDLLQQYLSEEPSLEKEFQLYQKTKLIPSKVIMPNKSSLYKSKVIPLWFKVVSSSVAASLLLFTWLNFGETERIYSSDLSSISTYLPTSYPMVSTESIEKENVPAKEVIEEIKHDLEMVEKNNIVLVERTNIEVEPKQFTMDKPEQIAFLADTNSLDFQSTEEKGLKSRLLAILPKDWKKMKTSEKLEYGSEVFSYLVDGKLAFKTAKNEEGEVVAWKARIGRYEIERSLN